MNFRLINVGIGDLQISKSPDILRTVLGSCVSICLYDTAARVAGMSHIMLPERKTEESSPMKYADTAIPMLIDEMLKAGAKRHALVAKISGGSMMFKVVENSLMGEIGKRNIFKVKEILDSLNIPVKAEDTGGDFGRTIDFFASDGKLKVKSIGREEKIL